MVWIVGACGVLGVVIITACLISLAATVADLNRRYQRPQFATGDVVVIQALGQEQACMVIDVNEYRTLVKPIGPVLSGTEAT